MEFDAVIEEFNVAHKTLQTEKLTVLQRANKGIALCHSTLSKMRVKVYQEGFSDKMKEISFFKDIKSIPMGHLVYYNEVRECEERLPKLGLKPKLKFLRGQRERINSFHKCHLSFHRYIMGERKDLDRHYFTRSPWIQPPMGIDNCGYDLMFNTSHDVLYAKFKGFERFGNYLVEYENRLKTLESVPASSVNNQKTPFNFTLPPTAAVEIAYAFREARAINHGDFEIKAFIDYFCEVFDIEIKEPYVLLSQITNRKKHRAKYLQRILDAFLGFLDERDE